MYLATAHSLLGHSEQAVTLFEECQQMCEARSEHWFRSYTLSVFGIEVWQQGDAARAIEMEHESIRLKQPFDDRLGIALCIEVLAWIAADGGDGDHAARLLGALREIWRSVGGPPFGYLATYRDQCQETARKRIGTKRFDALFSEGTRLSLDQTIAFTLEGRTPAAEPSARAGVSSPLTRRETEVARLVAKGKSNKEIAATLVISQRTAEGHVEHMLNKLGFNSRAQIAALIAELDDR
jgi:non-specific serine/threonine protein kinase